MTKKLEEETIDCHSSHVRLFGFNAQQNVNSAANIVFTSETGLPRVVLMLRWVLFVPKIFVSPLSESEQHIYGSDPRPDTGSKCSRRAVELSDRLHSPHNPKPQQRHFNNSTTRRPRSEKPLQYSESRTFLSFSCFSIANQEAVSRSAALLLRIKALALQKRPLFVLFALVGRTAAILDVAMLCAVEGAQCKTRELP